MKSFRRMGEGVKFFGRTRPEEVAAGGGVAPGGDYFFDDFFPSDFFPHDFFI